MTHNFPLPPNYVESLLNLTCLVIEKKPKNYMQFAAKYFGRLLNRESIEGQIIGLESMGLSRGNSQLSSTESWGTEEMDLRRQGVAGEHFDPDKADHVFEKHPKTESQKKHLLQACSDIAIFNSLTETDLNGVIDCMFEVRVKNGDEIIREGEDGDLFYVIEYGKYDAVIMKDGTPTVIKNYDGEGSFGELALILNAPRAATVVARSNGLLWALTRKVFRSLVLAKSAKKREQYNQILSKVPMLQTLSEYERANLSDALVSKECKKHELILSEGDPGNQMYFIVSGKVEIFRTIGDDHKVITMLGPGKYFGELALLSNQPRAASALAVEDTQLAILDVKGFERLMGPCIEIMKRNTQDYKKQVAEAFA